MRERVEHSEIALTEEEIKTYLEDEKKKHENLKEKLKTPADHFTYGIIMEGLDYDPFMLEVYQTYTKILKEKCGKFFALVDTLCHINACDDMEELLPTFDLDLHFNEKGQLHVEDVDRIAGAFLYNLEDLMEKKTKGNLFASYKVLPSVIERLKEIPDEIYPSKELQTDDLSRGFSKEFIPFTEKQKESFHKKEVENFTSWLGIVNEVTSKKEKVKHPGEAKQ